MQIDALQSDGFNVYMYLDTELVDVDHLCCLAHARAKFKYAFEQGKDEDAEYFIRLIGWLYDCGGEDPVSFYDWLIALEKEKDE